MKKSGRAKLTVEQADLIRAEYSQGGVSQRALAEKYKVSQMSIWQVLNGRTFRPGEAAA